MKFLRLPLAVIAFFVLAWPAAAQGDAPGPRKAKSLQPIAGYPTRVVLALRDIDRDEAKDLIRRLRGIARTTFECPGHPEATRTAAGTCEPCGGMKLKPLQHPIVSAVEYDRNRNTVVLLLEPGEILRRSVVQSALGKAARLDIKSLRLVGQVHCTVSWTEGQEGLDVIRKRLAGNSIVTLEGHDHRDDGTSVLRLRVSEKGSRITAPRLSNLLSPEARCVDLAWVGALPPKEPAAEEG